MDVTLGPLLADGINYGLELVLAAFVAFVAKKVKDKDAQHLVDEAAENAAAWAKSYADGKVVGVVLHPSFAGTNPMVAAGVQYMVDHVPAAMKWLSIDDPKMIAQKIMSRYTKLFEVTPPMTALAPAEFVNMPLPVSTQVVVHPGSSVTVNQPTVDSGVPPTDIVDVSGKPIVAPLATVLPG